MSGGEQRVRAAVGLVRRLADVGLRYRLRELQLLAVPCGAAFLPAFFARDSAPAAPMLLSAHYALAVSVSSEWGNHFPLAGALIALYAVLGMRLARLTVSPARPRRARAPRVFARRRWPLWLSAALLLFATAILT